MANRKISELNELTGTPAGTDIVPMVDGPGASSAETKKVTVTNLMGAAPVQSVAGRTGAVTLSNSDVSGLGSAATQNVGTSAGNVVQLDSSGNLPAVDGSNLTNVGSAGSVTSSSLATDSVTTTKIEDGAVTGAKIGTGTITNTNITNTTITGGKLVNNTITSTQLATDAVGTSEIADGAVTDAKLASGVGTSAGNFIKLDSTGKLPAVDGSQLTGVASGSAGSVDSTALASDAVTTTKIEDGAVTGSKIGTGTITDTNISNTTITGGKLVNNTITSTQIAANAVDTSELADGSVTTSKIANQAVTEEKIADGVITTQQLATTGSNAISVTNIQPKTIVVHVGNYYYNSQKYWASDAFNYNSSTDRYEARNVLTQGFEDSTAVGTHAWSFLHFDIDEQMVIEPFATVAAAARYALQNYGTNINVAFLIHGHVAAYGTYDQNAHTYKDINNFDSFSKVAIIGAAPGSYSGSDSHYTTFSRNGDTVGRIDFDQAPRAGLGGGYNLAWWFRGPIMRVSGTNQVFHNSSSTNSNMETRYGIGMNHDIVNNRMASVGNIGFFNPYHFLEGTIGYMSSGSTQPNEFYFSKGGRCFDVSGASQLVYSNNGTNHVYVDQDDTTNYYIRFANIQDRSSFNIKNGGTLVKYRSGKTYKAFSGSEHPITFHDGYSSFFTNLTTNLYVGGNGIGTDESDYSDDGYYMHRDVSSGGLSNTSSDRATYSSVSSTGSADESGTLFNRFNGSGYENASQTTLNAERLTSNASTIVAPTSRTGTGGTSSTNAPYISQ